MITILLLWITGIGPPANVRAHDVPSDGGGVVVIEWNLAPDDALLDGYEIHRSENGVDFVKVGFIGRGRRSFQDQTHDGTTYVYKVAAVSDTLRAFSLPSAEVTSHASWINVAKLNIYVAMIIFGGLILYFISCARRGKALFIRKIAGLQAIDDAVGRATEMGKPILYVLGLGYIEDIATIASLNILGEVAKKTAQYNTKLIVPNADPIVYTVAREIVKESYTNVGRPDAYDPESVFFLAREQMAYAAGVDGIMMREKPATNFLVGYFAAESLVLAETGAATGAIQIAGTDALSQLPFFVTACDYTLIGEELYAASAYISKRPLLLGAIKGEDYAKVIIAAALILASIIGLLSRFPILNLFQ
ncbi:fibronectin type III domain-containing protein [candidate division WOR-3 bacterium]|nr:fibronectin type III domain-containing protein [candidate division WOR-3 bacterium]